MTNLRLTRVLPLAVAVCGVLAGPANANHGTCERAGGLSIERLGPTGADACVLVSAGGVMVGADAINNCTFTGDCTTVGAHAELTGGDPRACAGATLNSTPLLSYCPIP